jgi:hypothetical protein
MIDEFFEYEAMTFALGGDLECPDCGMGYLIPVQTPSEDAQRLVCDVCGILGDKAFASTQRCWLWPLIT